MQSALCVDDVTREYAFGRVDRTVIHLWRAQLDGKRIASAKRHAERCRAELGRYALVTLFATDHGHFGPQISDDAREGVADMARWASDVVTAATGIVEGTGFLSAMIRAAGSGVAMLARPKYPVKIVATVSDATAWLGATLQWKPDAIRALADGIEALRARSLAL